MVQKTWFNPIGFSTSVVPVFSTSIITKISTGLKIEPVNLHLNDVEAQNSLISFFYMSSDL